MNDDEIVKAFDGFDVPRQNWSKLPHKLIDALHIISSESEIKVIIYILRHTWGYGDEKKRITLDEFANGRKRKDQTRLDKGTGLSINAVRDGLRRAVEHGFIVHEEDRSDLARIRNTFYLRMANSDGWVSTSDTPESDSDTLESESDSRTEIDTYSKKPAVRHLKRAGKKPPAKSAHKVPRDYFMPQFQKLATVFIKRSGLTCQNETDITFWENGSKSSNAKGFRQMIADGITPEHLAAAFDYIEAHNGQARNRNNQISLKNPNSIYAFAITAKNKNGQGTGQAEPDDDPGTIAL